MAFTPPSAASRPAISPGTTPATSAPTDAASAAPDSTAPWLARPRLRAAAPWPGLRLVTGAASPEAAALEPGQDGRRTRPAFAPPRGLYATWGKRWLDVALVLLAAPIAIPLVAMLAAWVRLDPRSGRAPAFFGQERVGRGGRPFTCWKIRTMLPDAEAELDRLLASDARSAAEWERRQKLERDPRVIPAGRLLRRSSLDELPQLWNVLIGDMSLVGPRPYTPSQRGMHALPELYESLRPGLTGYWQVGPRGEGGDFALRAVEDARYWRELSLAADLRVVLKTVGIVLKGGGR